MICRVPCIINVNMATIKEHNFKAPGIFWNTPCYKMTAPKKGKKAVYYDENRRYS